MALTERGQTNFLVHYLRYLGGNVLTVAAGFVSFPIMTRLLDNHQFGILGFYEACLLLLTGLLKLGAQHAILRFYPHSGGQIALRRFRTNYFLIPLAFSLALWLVCLACVALLVGRIPKEEQPILWIVIVIVPILIWSSYVEALLYALERSDVFFWIKILWRWSEAALVLLTIAFIERSTLGVFSARLLVAIVLATWLGWWFMRWCRGRLSLPSRGPILAGFAFGVPMMLTELTAVLFGFADRILLRALLGDFSEVGIYTIGFGLAVAATALMGQTLNEAFTPTAIRLYATRGSEAVVELKRDMLDVWALVVGLAAALLLCVGQDLFIIVAGQDKAASAPVFVGIAITLSWYSMFAIAQYGLLLQRRALRHFLITLSAAIFNIALNVPMILRWGVTGAVAATVTSYGFLALIQLWQCPAELRYLPRWHRLAATALYGPAMYVVLQATDYLGADSPFARLVIGLVILIPPMLCWAALDNHVRTGLRRILAARANP
jgi:O-antigen/teichoic acid export membrane protein